MKKFKITEEQIKEVYKPVYNYEGFYEVSNFGNVRSLSRNVRHSRNPEFIKTIVGKELRKTINNDGYFKVRLSKLGVKKTHLIHHLVAESFLNHTKRNSFICVDHIDEDKLNNNLNNLQIISKKQNTKKSFDNRLCNFKEGDYWFHNNGCLVLIFEVTKLHGGTIKCKHIDNEKYFAFHGINCMYRKATEEEVFNALKKEAEKRGFVKGAKVKDNGLHCSCIQNEILKDNTFRFYLHKNEMWMSVGEKNYGCLIFENGKWAEIISQPDEVIELNGVKYKRID